jgi:CheY-like chemotaxis protein
MNSDCAYSGKEGINLVKHRLSQGKMPYKLILTDINMPEMDGLQMSKTITQLLHVHKPYYYGSKIYAVTAMNDA